MFVDYTWQCMKLPEAVGHQSSSFGGQMVTQTVRQVKKDQVGEHSNVIAATADTSECVCVSV